MLKFGVSYLPIICTRYKLSRRALIWFYYFAPASHRCNNIPIDSVAIKRILPYLKLSLTGIILLCILYTQHYCSSKMPAKKKQQKNAFYYFMLDVQAEQRREGQPVPMQAVVGLSLPRWKTLPEDEKERYEKIAREEKKRARGVPIQNTNRLDNQGQLISTRKNVEEEADKRRNRETKYLLNRWSSGIDITQEDFCIISFQYLCHIEESEQYLPVEVAILKFNLASGIIDTFHKFINPGGIPLGYRFQCQNHSDETHQIPIEEFESADSNYRSIWLQMESFISSRQNNEYPPMFCMEYEMDCVESCMNWLYERACVGYVNRMQRIFFLENMIIELYKRKEEHASVTQIIELLSTSAYDYEANTRCAYHEEKEIKHCALGSVKRKAFALFQALGVIFNFDLTPNHLPVPPANKPTIKIIPPSVVSTNDSQMGRGWSHRREQGRASGMRQQEFGPGMGRGCPRSASDIFPSRDVRYQMSIGDAGEVYQSDEDTDVESTSAYSGSTYDDGRFSAAVSSTQTAAAAPQPAAPTNSIHSSASWPSLQDSRPKFAGRNGPPSPAEVPVPSKWTVGEQLAGASRQPRSQPRVLQGAMPSLKTPQGVSNSQRSSPPGGRGRGRTLQQCVLEQQMAIADERPTLAQAVARQQGQPTTTPNANPWNQQTSYSNLQASGGQPRAGGLQQGVGPRPGGRGRGAWAGSSTSEVSGVRDDAQSTVSSISYRSSAPIQPVGRGYNPWGAGGAKRAPPGTAAPKTIRPPGFYADASDCLSSLSMDG